MHSYTNLTTAILIGSFTYTSLLPQMARLARSKSTLTVLINRILWNEIIVVQMQDIYATVERVLEASKGAVGGTIGGCLLFHAVRTWR
jgi:hypothetical protein